MDYAGRKKGRKPCVYEDLRPNLDCLGLGDGGQYWDRTSDPRRVKAVLYP